MTGMRVTLCGSARFEDSFIEWNKRLTCRGMLVYSLGAYPSNFGGKDWYTEKQKEMLDKVHKEKIDNSDAILVLNCDGYIGESTKSEIEHAFITGKEIFYLSMLGEQPRPGRFICHYDGCINGHLCGPCSLCYE